MRVLVVTPWYPTDAHPYTGAFVERDVRMLRGGHDVTVAHLVAAGHQDDGPETIERDGVEVVRIPMSPADPRQWWRASRRLRALRGSANVVHSHAATSLWPMTLAGRSLVPWVHTEHSSAVAGSFGSTASARRSRAVRRRLFERPAVVVTVSEHLAELVRRLGRRGPVVVIPNAVDGPGALVPRRSSDGPLRLVAVGGLTDVKRPLLAVRALAELRGRGVDAELEWVGAGPLADPVVSLAAELGIAEHVRLSGAVTPDAVGARLEASDLFVMPTAGETFGVAIAEAIAHGRPVVTGAVGGQREFVDPAVGELVTGESPADYADAIERVVARTRGLTADEIAATLGDRFGDAARLAAYDEVYAQALRR